MTDSQSCRNARQFSPDKCRSLFDDCQCCDSAEFLFEFDDGSFCKMCILKKLELMPIDIEQRERYANSERLECYALDCSKDKGDLEGTACTCCGRWFCGYHDTGYLLLGYCSSCRSERD